MATNFYQKNKSKQKVLHYPTEIRSRFYQLVSSGNLQEVEAFLEKKDFRKLCDNNVLSETSVQNMRYHFIVTVTMLTHFCIQAGMPEVQAFDIQDNYIQSADQTHRLVDMEALHDEACMEYTLKMKRLQKQDISSKHIAICINYIHQNIRKKLSVPDIAEYLQLHPSYLSKLKSKWAAPFTVIFSCKKWRRQKTCCVIRIIPAGALLLRLHFLPRAILFSCSKNTRT